MVFERGFNPSSPTNSRTQAGIHRDAGLSFSHNQNEGSDYLVFPSDPGRSR